MPCVWLLHDKSQIYLDVAILDMAVYAEWLQNGDVVDHPHHRMFRALLEPVHK